jgi:hypothetical protein
MFDLKLPDGQIRRGTSNSHWYQLGLHKAAVCPWRSEGHTIESHPDSRTPIAGEALPQLPRCVELVKQAHAKLLPGVPLAGWDVAITTEVNGKPWDGICLLEANLSCNFFRASYDRDAYEAFVQETLLAIEGGGKSK